MSEWKEIKLNDYVDSISKTFKFTNKPVVFLNTSDILEGKVLHNNTSDPKSLPGQAKKSIKKGDLLFSEIRPANKRYALVDFDADNFVVSTKLMVLRAKNDINNSFLKLYLTSPEILNYLQMIAEDRSGSFPQITFDNIKSLELLLPPLQEQERIAEVLSSLDDKIDLLHRNNKTLEQLAETLFRQWFVEEAEDEVNEISLYEIAKHIKKNVNPSKTPDHFFKHYSLPAFDNGRNPEIQLGRDILSNKYQISPGQILISKLNPRTPRVWFINSCNNYSICSTEFQVYEPIKREYTEFIYCLLKSNDTRDILTGASSGTSGSHQRVNPEDINKLTIKKPNEERIKQFHQIASVWLNKIDKNSIQIQQLGTLRDTLLPKLMSGVVRVN